MREDIVHMGAVVEKRNLVMQHYSMAEISAASQRASGQGKHVKNFKRFKKVVFMNFKQIQSMDQ